mmetsp:Transcript_36028/g.41171  ORF Transcript_36028/g.41171 Transcript_36028/m.41171 type:complete len:269 (+) Transcript_36028:292-1098(+)
MSIPYWYGNNHLFPTITGRYGTDDRQMCLPVVEPHSNRITNGFTSFIAVIESTTSTLATFSTLATVVQATAFATVVTTVTATKITFWSRTIISTVKITRTKINDIVTIETIWTKHIITIETRTARTITRTIISGSFSSFSTFPTISTTTRYPTTGFTDFVTVFLRTAIVLITIGRCITHAGGGIVFALIDIVAVPIIVPSYTTTNDGGTTSCDKSRCSSTNNMVVVVVVTEATAVRVSVSITVTVGIVSPGAPVTTVSKGIVLISTKV